MSAAYPALAANGAYAGRQPRGSCESGAVRLPPHAPPLQRRPLALSPVQRFTTRSEEAGWALLNEGCEEALAQEGHLWTVGECGR